MHLGQSSNASLLALFLAVYVVSYNLKVAFSRGIGYVSQEEGFATHAAPRTYIRVSESASYPAGPIVVASSRRSMTADNSSTQPRIIVMSIWTHYPDLMRLHVASLRQFLTGYSELYYIAVLNSRSKDTNQQLADIAVSIDVTQLLMEINFNGDASAHHGYALNQGLQFLLMDQGPIVLNAKTDILWVLDSDIFLTEPTDLNIELQYNPIVSMMQSRFVVQYLWPNFLIAKLSNRQLYGELDFAPAVAQDENGTKWSLDSGGSTSIFVAQHPEINMTGIRNIDCQDESDVCIFYRREVKGVPRQCSPPTIMEFSERQDRCCPSNSLQLTKKQSSDCDKFARFYHLGSAGSNWRGCPERHLRQKRRRLLEYLKAKMSQKIQLQHFVKDKSVWRFLSKVL